MEILSVPLRRGSCGSNATGSRRHGFVSWRLGAVVGLWLAAVATGSTVLMRYEATPGAEQIAQAEWPAASRIPRHSDRPTLLIFVHPECFCTQASIHEFAALLAQPHGDLDARVVMLDAAGLPNPEETPIWRMASAIPGVTVMRDAEGAEARAFHGATSGDIMLYGAAGQLLFHGGITASRGQIGPSAGSQALAALLQGQPALQTRTPVFGCSLFSCEFHP